LHDGRVDMPDLSHGAGRAALRLHDDHVDFDRRFDELCPRLLAGDWRGLDVAWRALAADVDAHLQFEEEVLFPVFAKQSTECRDLVKRLVLEHAVIRELLEEIAIGIQLHQVRPWTIEVVIDLMREHAAVESERLYPWIELEGRPWSAGARAGAA
jgi:hemerythrin-like domain-containing protein